MTDLMISFRWWLVLFLIGMAFWPLVARIFPKWINQGYLLAKIFGLLSISFVIWILGSLGWVNFSLGLTAGILAVLGSVIWKTQINHVKLSSRTVWGDELLFILAFAFWTYIKGHAPDINGLEKFMDYGFAQSILKNEVIPPPDMWFAGAGINYYYFGHLLMAVLSKLANVDLAYGFNLMLSTLFALTFSQSFSIGRELLNDLGKKIAIFGALLISLLVSLSGNLQTIYAFTDGYQSDTPPPFWEIFVKPFNLDGVKAGFEKYWYPNATRFIPFTIHEFPGYSFVVSDIHGHVLSIPIVLLLVAILMNMWKKTDDNFWVELVLYGWLAGLAMMTNALDGPIYATLLVLCIICKKWPINKRVLTNVVSSILIVAGTMLLTVTPFLINFKTFVSGVAINCPPRFLEEKTFGPIIFEEAEKCQRSPFWMMLVLWGFFIYWVVTMFVIVPAKNQYRNLAICLSLFSLMLIIFPEFFYFKDIYPMHFRSNTMFKLGYQAFILLSIVSGWAITHLFYKITKSKKYWFYLIAGLPMLLLVLIYPFFSIKSYFSGLEEYKGLYGLEWMKLEYKENWMIVNWLNSLTSDKKPIYILEAQGDSYYDSKSQKPYNQISAFTGSPTVAGWYVHEWLWRGQEQIAQRSTDVRRMYENDDIEFTRGLLHKYRIKYVIVGEMEREKYLELNEDKFNTLGRKIYSAGQTNVYEIL